MFIKKRDASLQLKYLRALAPRMILPIKYQKKLIFLEDGIDGEGKSDVHLANSGWAAYVIPDLRWEMGGSNIQIDTVAVAERVVHTFDAKNWAGNYYMEGDRFFLQNGVEVRSPLQQANNIAIALKQVLRHWKCDFEVKHWVVFMNPALNLRNVKLTDPIIMPNQIERHLELLRQSAPNPTRADQELAMRLLQLHNPLSERKFLDLPDYVFATLAKGLPCSDCRALSMRVSDRTSTCNKCAQNKSVYPLILEAVKDFQLLFPNDRLTTSTLQEFCGDVVSRRMMRTALAKEYELVRYGNSSYYQ